MVMADAPTRPRNLGKAGADLWKRITGAYVIDVYEAPLLAAACRQADDVARLEEIIASDGVIVKGSTGQPRLSGAVTEVRQGRLALAKLLGELRLPADEGDDDRPMTAAQRRGQSGGVRRWANERAQRERAEHRQGGPLTDDQRG
jgi:hypothetical protein